MMKRDYRNEKQLADVVYFIGTEVEKTPFYGEKTLFVVGFRNPKKIALRAKENTCRHIYVLKIYIFIHIVVSLYN